MGNTPKKPGKQNAWDEAFDLLGNTFLEAVKRGREKVETEQANQQLPPNKWESLGAQVSELSNGGWLALNALLEGMRERCIIRYGPGSPHETDEAPFYGELLSVIEELQNLVDMKAGEEGGKDV